VKLLCTGMAIVYSMQLNLILCISVVKALFIQVSQESFWRQCRPPYCDYFIVLCWNVHQLNSVFAISIFWVKFLLFKSSQFPMIFCSFNKTFLDSCMTMAAIGAWLDQRYELSIFCVALSALLSWPFAALTGLVL